jgi:hypothetical protein
VSKLLLHLIGLAQQTIRWSSNYSVKRIFFSLAPLLGSSLSYWSTELITQFLDLPQAVGLLGRMISSSQGLYLNRGQHKHRKTQTYIKLPCPVRDSNLQSLPPSDRRRFMTQTARLQRPVWKGIDYGKWSTYLHSCTTEIRKSTAVSSASSQKQSFVLAAALSVLNR